MSSIATPGLVFGANKALIASRKYIAKIRQFATDFTDEAIQAGATMKIPVYNGAPASTFNASSNNYENTDGSVTWVSVTFGNHYKSTFEITDKDMLDFNATSFWTNVGIAQGRAIGLAIESAVGGLFTTTAITNTANIGATITKKSMASVRVNSASVGADPARSVMLLAPAVFAEVLALLDANVYGNAQAIQDGMVEGLYGYKAIMECSSLPQGVAGVVVPEDAVAVASRLIRVGSPKVYEEVGSAVDPDSGFVVGVRRHGSPAKGTNFGTMEVLFGAALAQAGKCLLLTQTSSSSGGTTNGGGGGTTTDPSGQS